MSIDAAPSPTLLSSLDLRIGQTVQVIIHRPRAAKYYTQLIGFVEHEFILLRPPKVDGWAVQLEVGRELAIRVISGVSIYEFETHLIAQLLHPRNYLTLGYPISIRQTRLRSHKRARCDLPVVVTRDAAGMAHSSGYRFQDLSGGGAALVGEHRLGEPGQPLTIEARFRLAATGTDERVELSAVIQSVQPLRKQSSTVAGFNHGIQFEAVDSRILLLVYELQRAARANTF